MMHWLVLAIGGGWFTGHSNDEHHGGAEVAIERDLGDIYRVGGGVEVMEYVIHDDECYGSTGHFAGAFATAGLREPTAETVHFFGGTIHRRPRVRRCGRSRRRKTTFDNDFV